MYKRQDSYRRDLVKGQSARLVCGYIYATAGEGESSQDLVFGGQNLIAEKMCIRDRVKPSLESRASQIVDSQSLDDLKYSTDRKYTSQLLISAIEDALKKAENHVSSPPAEQ